jgi:hypothetical protein
MHATTEQLIELRDGTPIDATVLNHVDLCEACSQELRSLRERRLALQALPQLSPSPRSYELISAAVATRRESGHRPAQRPRPLQWAAAAAVVAALALWLVPRNPEDGMTQVAQIPPAAVAQSSTGQQRVTAEDLVLRDELLDRSAALEAVAVQLATLGSSEPSASTDDALSALEAQLALVDYNLSAAQIDQYKPTELNALLQRRVNTLEDIVGVQRAELARQGYHGFQLMTAANFEEDQTW